MKGSSLFGSKQKSASKEGRRRERCKDKEKRNGEVSERKREEVFQDAITTFLGRASNQQLFL